ncbi:MAG: alpha/beta fold hydrolase [Pseudomonadota bacterium]|nr:alpha/beta fold hydrolase [Pseudomonadota bacterium]
MLQRFLLIGWIGALAVGCAPWHTPPGPSRQEPELLSEAILAADGIALPLRRWGPAEQPRAVVLALHGFNDYSEAFAKPGRYFANAGVVTYAYDQRGFGKAPNKGFWSSVDGMTDDLRAAAKLIRAAHPDAPFYIIGESMGAAVILATMNQDSPPPVADGYVLSAPAVWGRRIMPWWQRWALEFFAHTIPLFHVSGQGFNRIPSDNMEMLRKRGRDPLVIKHTRIDTLYGLVNLMDAALNAVPRLVGHSLVLLGQKEDIMLNEVTHALLSSLPRHGCVRVAKYSSGYHMLLRDIKADIVLDDLVTWMGDPKGLLPSGSELTSVDELAPSTQEPGVDSQLGLSC